MSGSLYLSFSKSYVIFKRHALEIKAYGGTVTGLESHCETVEEEASSQRAGLFALYLMLSFPSLSLAARLP